ncbi:hypothetical protein [Blastopirellula marina]|uniref:Uncharacterized protein n=1 Tax=Blastopirellula marina TaxID=124 RepID=A0A2S8FMM0_9BACT|nr:hypothetical protein [Blastopirellula marina]PQO33104.1 hypothetical protein C5Y98_18400 [Blastopirellula marina]PTL43271.1 hypothetical protein C5Y97_18410 [Blastopirellula marina]
MLVKSLLWTGMLGVAMVSTSSTAQADHFTHQGRLVRDIEVLHHAVDDFYNEVRHHNRFSHLATEARALLREVDHFCDTAQHHGSLGHLKTDFRDVSREMRHVQQDMQRAWRRHHQHHDDHIQLAWANVERAFDRVYFDLYESHCGYIQYHCTIGHGPGHHHGNPGPFIPGNGPYYNGNQGAISFGQKNGKIQVQVHGNAPAWAHLLKAAIK